ncbi:hypothetical protein EKK58_12295 [Candidatus Dependentiae bacterium]|nr:MAG: hypothetical protein EKK58_12295 [Candidatus Dependentiae bacterium]
MCHQRGTRCGRDETVERAQRARRFVVERLCTRSRG